MSTEDSILKIFQHHSEETDILVNYVALVEVMDGDTGRKGLRLFCSDGVTPWLATGILQTGLELVAMIDDEDDGE